MSHSRSVVAQPAGVELRASPTWEARSSALTGPRALGPLLAAALVLVLTVLAIQTARSGGMVAALWGAGAVGVIGWLRGPASRSYDIAYGLLLTAAFGLGNFLAGNPAGVTAMFTAGNLIEVITAVALVRRFSPQVDFGSVAGLGKFLTCTAILAPLPAGVFISLCMAAAGDDLVRATFETWWFGHALGFAVITPVGLALNRRALALLKNPLRLLEAVALVAGVTGVAWVVFFNMEAPIAFLLTPLLIAAAARMRVLGASVTILLVTIIAIMGTLQGAGPFATSGDMIDNARLAQLFLIMGCLPALLVAALLEERDRYGAIARADQAKAESASEGKSRLLANVSHEIKSPVAGIIGIGELWSSGKLGPVTPMQAEMSEMLVSTARQVEALANDLLDVARAEAGAVSVNLRPVDVDGLVEDVRRAVALKPEAAAMKLVVEGAGERLVARADSVRLAQIVTNLATNAVKYGASGGLVVFRLSQPSSRRVRIEVIDRGPGLTPEKQAQLFEPFNRLGMERSTVEGHGIGLALAKRLAELQGGRIGVTSEPGRGSCFWLELPAA